MDQPTEASIQAVAALDEPTRRRLYDHVVAEPAPVSREEAAAALGIPRTTTAFHLDKLAGEGLLTVVFERRTGRSGPGAGRPAKLYRRSDREIGVSIPERQYDVAGHLLAAAVEDAEASGCSPRSALERRAREYGESAARAHPGTPLAEVLQAHGFEPRRTGSVVELANCPFKALARNHPELVCNMTLHLLGGLLDGLGDTEFQAMLEPRPGHCCVRLTPLPTS
ncbi:helix-turn-helix transcriptional regulator [Kribbella sp. CA-293567]|uniref:helix-turn-helix transcriptional regulator n=1 Tax=Kribbella sp. CA-293567 TaxID=3002436 RepID=UPI0022DE5A64|nr:helix-turn-helix domain-containing protein [Kribbella sp. CA-293567]WBQ02799.1 helix-turn-helix domain-containing protein [Kribbella sp. CA-293567]